MRRGWGRITPLCALVLVACASAAPPPYNESLITAFDPKEWSVGHQAEDRRQRLVEMVAPGQPITAWQELLTVHVLAKPQPTPSIDVLAAAAPDLLRKRCPSGVAHNVIQRGLGSDVEEASLLYEWSVKDCPPEADQHEVARIIYGKFTIYRVAYVAKTRTLEPAKRDKWIRELSGARLVVSK
jgi:hypothetical protein